MNASKTNTAELPPRLIVAHLQGKHAEGDTFLDWPLHVTVLPWFHNEVAWTIELFRRVTADLHACTVSLGPRTLGTIAMHGPKEDIPVRPIKESTALGVVHGVFLGHLHPFLNDKTYASSRYNPHVSIHENPDPGEGRVINVDSLSLIQHLGDEGGRQKLILARTELPQYEKPA